MVKIERELNNVQCKTAIKYINGEDGCPKDEDRAFELLHEVWSDAEKVSDVTEAMFCITKIYESGVRGKFTETIYNQCKNVLNVENPGAVRVRVKP